VSGETIEAFGRKWKRVWQENAGTKASGDPSHEYTSAAWERLFGEKPMLDEAGPEEDHDTGFYFLHAGRVVDYSDAGNSIYVPVEVSGVVFSRVVGDPPGAVTAHLLGAVHPVPAGAAIEYVPPADPYTTMAREFHERMGLVTRDAPSLGTPAEREERVRLMLEELIELAGALGVKVRTRHGWEVQKVSDFDLWAGPCDDIPSALHELADLQVTVSGTAVQFGLPLLAATRAVHAANMQKTPQGPGRKPLKPPGWKPADVSALIAPHVCDPPCLSGIDCDCTCHGAHA
jgi:predicted HAD superfamily Cof-like phosphohydrolase